MLGQERLEASGLVRRQSWSLGHPPGPRGFGGSLPGAPKPAFQIVADFGKYGRRTTVGRFTCHSADELVGQSILGVLNFEPREIGGVTSEFLCLGVQFPKAESGEATPLVPLNKDAKLGSKVF